MSIAWRNQYQCGQRGVIWVAAASWVTITWAYLYVPVGVHPEGASSRASAVKGHLHEKPCTMLGPCPGLLGAVLQASLCLLPSCLSSISGQALGLPSHQVKADAPTSSMPDAGELPDEERSLQVIWRGVHLRASEPGRGRGPHLEELVPPWWNGLRAPEHGRMDHGGQAGIRARGAWSSQQAPQGKGPRSQAAAARVASAAPAPHHVLTLGSGP